MRVIWLGLCCVGCGGEPWPDSALYGMWANERDGEHWVFVFEREGTGTVFDTPQAFHLYGYVPGLEPIELMAGAFDIQEGGLYQQVTVWRGEPTDVEYWNEIFDLTVDELVIASDEGLNGRRVYAAVDAFP